MHRVITLALTLAVGVFVCAAPAQDKKKKQKKGDEAAPTVVSPVTSADSLSYAAGMMATDGLMPFLQQQYGMKATEAQLEAFVNGYNHYLESAGDSLASAYNAGMQIAEMTNKRMLPGIGDDLKDTPDSLRTPLFYQGFIDGVKGNVQVYTVDEAKRVFKERRDSIVNQKNEAYKQKNEAWLKANATNDGVKTTASGLQYKVITTGTGEVPTKTDKVEVKYEGKMIDGTVFDSSYKRNPQTTKFRADQVIKGWTEALTMMPVGSKWELYIPQELGYGSRTAGQIKPYSTLIFTVELVGIEKKAEATTKADDGKM